MGALERFVDWLGAYTFVDRNRRLPEGVRLQYHSRSDEHSKKLGELILEDILDTCPIIREQAARGEVAYGINYAFVWPDGKAKTLDLVVGTPQTLQLPPTGERIRRLRSQAPAYRPAVNSFSRILIACEEKTVMTEHGKSQPRIYSELNDSHTIVHQGSRDTIAAGITTINIASSFISPLRQRPDKPIEISHHNQPQVTANMVAHLRTLPIRETIDDVGLDVYCTFVVDLDNQGHVALHTQAPAPQVGDRDHYATFLQRICSFYAERFSDLPQHPRTSGLTIEESLVGLARDYPGLLEKAAGLVIREGGSGTRELYAILQSLEHQVNPPIKE